MRGGKPNKITGANAGGPRQLPMRTRWTARVAQFCRSRKIFLASLVQVVQTGRVSSAPEG